MSDTTLNGSSSAFKTLFDDMQKQQQIANQAKAAAAGYEFSPTIVNGVDQSKIGNIIGNTSGGVIPTQTEDSWFNSGNLSAAAGLASALTQAIALPDQLKNMRLQRKAMEHNLATAKEEQARRNKSISSFNNFQSIEGS